MIYSLRRLVHVQCTCMSNQLEGRGFQVPNYVVQTQFTYSQLPITIHDQRCFQGRAGKQGNISARQAKTGQSQHALCILEEERKKWQWRLGTRLCTYPRLFCATGQAKLHACIFSCSANDSFITHKQGSLHVALEGHRTPLL